MATYTWTGASSTSMDLAANWSNDGGAPLADTIPGADDTAVLASAPANKPLSGSCAAKDVTNNIATWGSPTVTFTGGSGGGTFTSPKVIPAGVTIGAEETPGFSKIDITTAFGRITGGTFYPPVYLSGTNVNAVAGGTFVDLHIIDAATGVGDWAAVIITGHVFVSLAWLEALIAMDLPASTHIEEDGIAVAAVADKIATGTTILGIAGTEPAASGSIIYNSGMGMGI